MHLSLNFHPKRLQHCVLRLYANKNKKGAIKTDGF